MVDRARYPSRSITLTNPKIERCPPPLHLNALVMLIANFSGSDYATGLRILSRTITFFHQNPVFIPDPQPGLPPDNIVLDFVNIDLAQTRDSVGMLGLKYLPSALYRMRTLTFSSDARPTGAAPARVDRGLQRSPAPQKN